jgi:hypothetical protein
VRLSNIGGQTLSWTALVTGGTAWCSVSPASGNADVDSFDVAMTTTDLAEGTYDGEITMGGNASNAGLKIIVRYIVSAKKFHAISGRVTFRSGPDTLPIPGLVMFLSGDATEFVNTNPGGFYSFPAVAEGNYTVNPLSIFFDFTPADRSFTPLNANVTNADFLGTAKQGTVRIRYKQGWNLISLPLVPGDGSVSVLFPQAEGMAYYYVSDSGYVPTARLEYGRGYWVKFSQTDSVEVTGTLQVSSLIKLKAASGGWNLVGIPSNPVEISKIVQNPAGSILLVYEYDPWFGYFLPSGGFLRPGRAYFFKTAVDADITLNISLFAPPNPPFESMMFPGAALLDRLPPSPPKVE